VAEIIYKQESYAIVGACLAVYQDKGCGFHEALYQECLEIELGYRGIPFDAQREVRLTYRGRELRQRFIPDIVCYDKIVVELKAVSELIHEHPAQVLNYLNATGMKLGLLVNFGHYPKLECRRIVLTERGRPSPDASPARESTH
jgi:GxxExxY protein